MKSTRPQLNSSQPNPTLHSTNIQVLKHGSSSCASMLCWSREPVQIALSNASTNLISNHQKIAQKAILFLLCGKSIFRANALAI